MSSLAIGSSFAKGLFPFIGAEGATSLRLMYATLLLMVMFRPWKNRVSKSEAYSIIPYGIALGGMNLCFYKSLETIPLGLAVALEFLGPLTLAVLSSRHKLDYLWIVLASIGVLLLLPLPFNMNMEALDQKGVLFAVIAGGFWALYIIFGKKCTQIDSGKAISYGMATAALIILPFSLYSSGTKVFSTSFLLLGLFVAIFSSALPYTLEMLALKGLTQNKFSILLSLEPVICAIAGIFILKEWLLIREWLAILFILVASIGCLKAKNA